MMVALLKIFHPCLLSVKFYIKFLKLYFTTDFTDYTDYGCVLLMLFHRLYTTDCGLHELWLRVADAISQIYYWITAANAAMINAHDHRFHRLHGLWLRVADAISRIYYWITAANATMINAHDHRFHRLH